jgi:hypothetical protein
MRASLAVNWLRLVSLSARLNRLRFAKPVAPAMRWNWLRFVKTGVRSRACRLAVPSAQIAWAVGAAARFVPRATCLVRAIAAQRLLARYGYDSQVHIGVTKASGDFQAHAWVERDGVVCVGASEVPYTPLLHWRAVR